MFLKMKMDLSKFQTWLNCSSNVASTLLGCKWFCMFLFLPSYLHIYCGACVRLSCLNLCQLLSLSQRRLETAKGGKLAPNLQSLAKTLRKWWMGLFQGHVHTYIDFCETFKNFNIFRFPLQSAFVTSEKWHQAPHNSLVSNLLANSAWLRIKAFA